MLIHFFYIFNVAILSKINSEYTMFYSEQMNELTKKKEHRN